MKTASPLPWLGSDSPIAARIAELAPHKHVTLPMCGGLSILPHLKAKCVVCNDLHRHAINFYHVAQGHYGEDARTHLFMRAAYTLSHPCEVEDALGILTEDEDPPAHWQAWAFWAICWIGRKGMGGSSAQLKAIIPSFRKTPGGGSNATRIQSAALDLTAWANEFKRCEFRCVDFRKVLKDATDSEECAIYCDPPSMRAGKRYLHPFESQDHVELHLALERFEKTRIIVRYDNDQFVREMYVDWEQEVIEKEVLLWKN